MSVDHQGDEPQDHGSAVGVPSFFDLSLDPSFELDAEGRITRANDAWRQVLGFGPESLLGRPLADFVHVDDRAQLRMKLEAPEARFDVRFRPRGGGVCRLHLRIASTGETTRGVARETTVYDERHFSRGVLGATSTVIGVVDREGTVIACNRAAERLSGCLASEIVGRPFWETGLTNEQDASRFSAWLASMSLEDFPLVREQLWFARDGSAVRLQWTITGLFDGEGKVTHLVGVGEDPSVRRRLESWTDHGQKMDAVGRFAARVAHDYSNILSVVLNSCEFALEAMGEDTEAYDDVCTAHDAAIRGSALTRQLMLFGHHDAATSEVLDVRRTLGGMEPALRSICGGRIELELVVPDEVDNIEIPRAHFEQVLCNLVRNAVEAIGAAGAITVSVEARAPDAGPGTLATSGVAIVVSDTGAGMSPESLLRACEPFFTTRRGHRGLGLAVVYGLITRAGGVVHLESPAGHGARVSVCLPASSNRAVGLTPHGGAGVDTPLRERVLVVEDEGPVRRAVARLLQRAGFEALEAATAEEALERLAQGRDVDIILSDVVMPGLSGPEMAARLAETRPEIPVVYMSGYAADHLRDHGVDDTRFLHKPFKEAQVVRLLRRALDGDEG